MSEAGRQYPVRREQPTVRARLDALRTAYQQGLDPDPAPQLDAQRREWWTLESVFGAIADLNNAPANRSVDDFPYFVADPFRPFDIDPSRLAEYTMLRPFFQITGRTPEQLSWRADPNLVPSAYDNPQDPDPVNSTNEMYADGERITSGDGGLLALSAASAEAVQGRMALFTTFADTVLTIHEQLPRHLAEWALAQANQPDQFGMNSFNLFLQFDQGRPVEERLIDLPKFDITWRDRIQELRRLFARQPIRLQPPHFRWLEFLSHSVNLPRVNQELQEPPYTSPPEVIAPVVHLRGGRNPGRGIVSQFAHAVIDPFAQSRLARWYRRWNTRDPST